ncbi:hypothetical protein CEXT_650701 [Caerostris extrusa]|uniref:Uncharacterized protein n=1 Tax=Caerostris extrusa TaxID=172846 RepID=A0AAV4WDN8_CAEEX|nr:hypothetical protein CEXT_650701 [Caerostris extrusa]
MGSIHFQAAPALTIFKPFICWCDFVSLRRVTKQTKALLDGFVTCILPVTAAGCCITGARGLGLRLNDRSAKRPRGLWPYCSCHCSRARYMPPANEKFIICVKQ